MTNSDVENYRQIKSDLDKLRLLVEKSELWVYKSKHGDDAPKKKSKKKANTEDGDDSKEALEKSEKKARRDTMVSRMKIFSSLFFLLKTEEREIKVCYILLFSILLLFLYFDCFFSQKVFLSMD